MSLQDQLSQGNALQLLTIGAGLALASTGGRHRYNFALFLFGIVAHELQTSSQALRIFISFVFFTAIYDIFLIILGRDGSTWSTICAFLILVLKVPIFYTCLNALRDRGGDISFGVPNIQGLQGFGRPPTQAPGGNGNWGGMPGGFSSAPPPPPATHGGSAGAPPPPAPSTFPAGGGFRLGGDEDENEGDNTKTSGNPPTAPPPGRNGYSSIA